MAGCIWVFFLFDRMSTYFFTKKIIGNSLETFEERPPEPTFDDIFDDKTETAEAPKRPTTQNLGVPGKSHKPRITLRRNCSKFMTQPYFRGKLF